MKVTVAQILNAQPGFTNLIKLSGLTVGTAYKIKKLVSAYNEVFKNANDQKLEIMKEFGEEKDGMITVPEENFEAADAKMQELGAIEEDIDVDVIVIPGDITGLTVEDIALLEPFIEIKE